MILPFVFGTHPPTLGEVGPVKTESNTKTLGKIVKSNQPEISGQRSEVGVGGQKKHFGLRIADFEFKDPDLRGDFHLWLKFNFLTRSNPWTIRNPQFEIRNHLCSLFRAPGSLLFALPCLALSRVAKPEITNQRSEVGD
jgi:hypothetical protein